LARVNRKTAAYFFHRLRQIIAGQLEGSLPVEGLVEVDEIASCSNAAWYSTHVDTGADERLARWRGCKW
jgi:hypothetical protein